MKRVKYGKEPVLHVHRYIVAVGRQKKNHWHTKFFYCQNLAEMRDRRDRAPNKGSVVEVYSATHNFREAWEK